MANAQRYGGDFRVAGETSLTSGTLEVVLLKEVGRLLRPDVLVDLLGGRPLDRHATSFLAKELSAASGAPVPVQLDGELWRELPVSFRVEPRALKVVC